MVGGRLRRRPGHSPTAGFDQYIGKFFILTPKSLHRRLDQLADMEGISLNQFMVSTLSKAVGQEEVKRKKKAQK
jgi:predicted HicB family RNase H-like nuclease